MNSEVHNLARTPVIPATAVVAGNMSFPPNTRETRWSGKEDSNLRPLPPESKAPKLNGIEPDLAAQKLAQFLGHVPDGFTPKVHADTSGPCLDLTPAPVRVEDDKYIIDLRWEGGRWEWDVAYKPKPIPPADWTPDRTRGFCYFIGAADGPIKIGSANNVESRLRSLQCGNPRPLTILARVPGGYDAEHSYHLRFAKHRICGEWFDRTPEVLAEIERLSS